MNGSFEDAFEAHRYTPPKSPIFVGISPYTTVPRVSFSRAQYAGSPPRDTPPTSFFAIIHPRSSRTSVVPSVSVLSVIPPVGGFLRPPWPLVIPSLLWRHPFSSCFGWDTFLFTLAMVLESSRSNIYNLELVRRVE